MGGTRKNCSDTRYHAIEKRNILRNVHSVTHCCILDHCTVVVFAFENPFFLCTYLGCLSVPVARELVLDYIIERKRMDDLCGSIIDGRFREQKVS